MLQETVSQPRPRTAVERLQAAEHRLIALLQDEAISIASVDFAGARLAKTRAKWESYDFRHLERDVLVERLPPGDVAELRRAEEQYARLLADDTSSDSARLAADNEVESALTALLATPAARAVLLQALAERPPAPAPAPIP